MAYQAKRHKRFQEDFELVGVDGEVTHILHVDLDADDMIPKINRKYIALTRALSETEKLKRNSNDTEEVQQCFGVLGRAVVDLIEAVFGEEDARTIVEFYENRYIEMTQEVLPFISGVVIPRMTEIRNENKKMTLSGYNRKQRRRLLKA